MKVLLTLATVLSLWLGAHCFISQATHSVKNPPKVVVTEHVYFDIKVRSFYKLGEDLTGRFVVAVFGDLLPMTALNFVSLARGYKRGSRFLSYNNTQVHRIVPDFVIQMGDVDDKFGQGGTSIYGDKFADEGYVISHASSGIVSMANTGKDTNNSQFFVTLQTTRFLDGRHVAFGKVIAGMDLIKKIGNMETRKGSGIPSRKVLITESGVEGLYNKYDMTDQQLETNSEDFNSADFYMQKQDDDDDE